MYITNIHIIIVIVKNILYLVAFLEGFSTLAVELLAIRILIPVVGSSVVLTGVVLSVILLALSLGYEQGGRLAQSGRRREALVFNLTLSGTLYAWGLFLLPRLGDGLVDGLGLSWGLLLAAVLALGLPVFLASCTIPVLVQMLAEAEDGTGQSGRWTGRLLLVSTLGSVAGGLLPPMLLFGWAGVGWTAVGVVLTLWLCAALLSFGRGSGGRPATVLLLAGLPALLFLSIPSSDLFHRDSAYQQLRVARVGGERILFTNGQAASGLTWPAKQPSFSYVREALEVLSERPLGNALFLGAAGMVLPERLERDRGVDALSVDLDPAVREAALALWGEPLRGRFLAASARAVVRKCEPRQYDLVFLDTFSGNAPPPETLTLEYLRQAQRCGRLVIANAIFDKGMKSAFSSSVLSTARAAWGAVYYRQAATMPGSLADNYLLSDQPLPGFASYPGKGVIYRDGRHTIERDWLAVASIKTK